MNTTELLSQPVDPQLLGLLELPRDLPERLSIAEAAAITGLTPVGTRYPDMTWVDRSTAALD